MNAGQSTRSAAEKTDARRCAASAMTVAGANADKSTPCQLAGAAGSDSQVRSTRENPQVVEPNADSQNVYVLPFDDQILFFLDEHRLMIDSCLDGLTEEQARRKLVASKTTLLGLVKHATFVERVWFEEAFTGQSRSALGIEQDPEASFALEPGDTTQSVQSAYRTACQHSREAVTGMALDDLVAGNRRGALPLRWILLHTLREVAQHCGHADILRELVLAEEHP